MTKVKVNYGAVFQRNEKKFLLTPEQYFALAKALNPYMQPDQYGLHTICTIYYDTEEYDIIRRSLDKPTYKEKLRLRSYGVPGEEDIVYLELKKKLDKVTYKRRIPLSLREARNYLEKNILPQDLNQIFGEINWFVERHHPTAKILLSYDRLALFGKDDSQLRVTFDANIRWRDYNLDLAKGVYGQALIAQGMRLMEIKTLNAFPLWLCHLLSKLEIYPTSFSKYGTVYQQHLINKEEIRHVG